MDGWILPILFSGFLFNTIDHIHVHALIIIRIVWSGLSYEYVLLSSAWPLSLWWSFRRRWQKGTALFLYAFVRAKLTLYCSLFLVSMSCFSEVTHIWLFKYKKGPPILFAFILWLALPSPKYIRIFIGSFHDPPNIFGY